MTLAASRAVIVGAGLMSQWHAAAARRAGARIVAVADADRSRPAALTRRVGGEVAASLAAVTPAPEVVHVCTPTSTDEALTCEALERGAHVLVEKPLAGSPDAVERLLAMAASRGRLICPVHQFPFQRGVRTVRDRLARLGSVRPVDVVMCSAGADGLDDGDADRIAFEVLPHPLSLLAALIPASAGALRWSGARVAPGEWRVLAVAPSQSVSLLVSMSGRPTSNECRIIGDRGTAHLDLFHGFATFESGAVSRWRKMTRPFVRAATGGAAAGLNLARRVRRREPAYPGLWELVDAFYVAARRGLDNPIAYDEIRWIAQASAQIHAVVHAPSPDVLTS